MVYCGSAFLSTCQAVILMVFDILLLIILSNILPKLLAGVIPLSFEHFPFVPLPLYSLITSPVCHWVGILCVCIITSPPIGGGRGIVMPMSVCVFVCLCVCVFVCPCFRKISKCNISAISQPIIMKLGIHITYGYTVTDKYFQNFRSKVKVVGRRKVKNVIWPYLGNEWS